MKNPLVSVIITAYNEERHIAESLESLIQQTYPQLEIIVVDDCSTDTTASIVETMRKQDSRIRLIRLQKNLGQSAASNVGIDVSTGGYIARLDADDISLPDRINVQVDFLLNHPDVVMVGGQCRLINADGKVLAYQSFPLTHKQIYRALFVMNPILHPTIMINRRHLPEGKIYYHSAYELANDLELVFEAAQYGKLANVKDVVVLYRQQADSMSLSKTKATFHDTVVIRQKAVREYGYKPTLIGRILHVLECLVVRLLPQKYIYIVFQLWRTGKRIILQ